MKILLVLGATSFQVPLIKQAKKMGNYVITTDYNLDNPGHRYSNECINISTIDLKEILEFVKLKKIDGIITSSSDIAVSTIGYICDKLCLPGISFDQGNILTKKNLFRKFQKEEKFNYPEFYVFNEASKFISTTQKLEGTYIMKPVDRSGSIGVKILFCPIKKEDILYVEKQFNEVKNSSFMKMIILEEFIEGIEYGGDMFIKDGEIKSFCITNKKLLGVIPIGHTIPVKLPQKMQNIIKKNLKSVLDRLKIKNGPVNFDVMVNNNNEVFILEMSPRLGGNCIPQIIKFGTGFDEIKESINIALDLPPRFFRKKISTPAGARILKSLKTGKINYLSPKKDIFSKFSTFLKELLYDHKPGENVFKFDQGNKRIGHFIIVADFLNDLESIIEEIENEIRIVIE